MSDLSNDFPRINAIAAENIAARIAQWESEWLARSERQLAEFRAGLCSANQHQETCVQRDAA